LRIFERATLRRQIQTIGYLLSMTRTRIWLHQGVLICENVAHSLREVLPGQELFHLKMMLILSQDTVPPFFDRTRTVFCRKVPLRTKIGAKMIDVLLSGA
jgi:hypothetical protein